MSKGTAASSSRAGSPERGSTAAAQQAYQELDHDMKMRLVRIDNALMSLPKEQQAVVQQEIQAALETKATTEDVQRREDLKARTAASETTSTQYRSKSLQDKGKQKKADKVGKARKESEENVALVNAHVNAESGQSTSDTKPGASPRVKRVKTGEGEDRMVDKLRADIDKEKALENRFTFELTQMAAENAADVQAGREPRWSQKKLGKKATAKLDAIKRRQEMKTHMLVRKGYNADAKAAGLQYKIKERRAKMNPDAAVEREEELRKEAKRKKKKGVGK